MFCCNLKIQFFAKFKVDPITKNLGTIESREKVQLGLYSWLALSRNG